MKEENLVVLARSGLQTLKDSGPVSVEFERGYNAAFDLIKLYASKEKDNHG